MSPTSCAPPSRPWARPPLPATRSTSPPVVASRSSSSLASELGREDLEPELPGEFRAGDIRHCLADTTRARELLGFEAETELADGLPELAEWVAGQTVTERGDEAVAEMRARNLVG
jgi:dTDP-L-rhamnose 4-epimerase